MKHLFYGCFTYVQRLAGLLLSSGLILGAVSGGVMAKDRLGGELSLSLPNYSSDCCKGSHAGMRLIGSLEDQDNSGGLDLLWHAGTSSTNGAGIDSIYGVYKRVNIALRDQADLMLRLGAAYTTVTETRDSTGNTKASTRESNLHFSFGFGVHWYFHPKLVATVDYMWYPAKSGAQLQGLAVGVKF